MNLFKTSINKVEQTKIAAIGILGDDVGNWPTEIQDSILKKFPFLADYNLTLTIDRQRPEHGAVYGHLEVASRTITDTPAKKITIPVIVNSGAIANTDVYQDENDKSWPVTEERIEHALSTIEAAGEPADLPGPMGMSTPDQMAPVGQETINSTVKNGAFIDEVLPTVSNVKLAAFKNEINSSDIKHAYAQAGRGSVLNYITNYDLPDTSESKIAAMDIATTPVAILIKGLPSEEMLLVKKAYARPYGLDEFKVPFDTAYNLVKSEEAVEDLFKGGSLIDSVGGNYNEVTEQSPAIEITEDTTCQVKLANGHKDVGHVFTDNVYNIDGSPTNNILFIGKEASWFGEKLYGHPTEAAKLGELLDIPDDTSSWGDQNVLLYSHNGKTKMSSPITIRNIVKEAGSTQLNIETINGKRETIKIAAQYSLVKPTVANGIIYYPSNTKIATIAAVKPMVDRPFKKTATIKPTAELRYNGSTYSFTDLGCGLSKLGFMQGELTNDDALFALTTLGMTVPQGTMKLAEAKTVSKPFPLYFTDKVVTLSEASKLASSTKQGNRIDLDISSVMPPYMSLVKLGAFVPDPNSIDTLLSLGLLDTNNVEVFIEKIPMFEETLSALCELLMSARLGLDDIPIDMLEPTIKHLDEVIKGLKILAVRMAQ